MREEMLLMQGERVDGGCYTLDAAVVEVGEKGVCWKVRWELATVLFLHGKFCREGVR